MFAYYVFHPYILILFSPLMITSIKTNHNLLELKIKLPTWVLHTESRAQPKYHENRRKQTKTDENRGNKMITGVTDMVTDGNSINLFCTMYLEQHAV
jgi:hypothetical protein